MENERKKLPWSKKSPEKNRFQQLQTHNLSTDNVENTNGTN